MQIIELDSFMTAFPVMPGDEDAAKRRFMTLLGETGAHAKVGGTSYVSRAWTLAGEPLALKRLLPDAGIPTDVELSTEDSARITQGHAAAFYEEYRNQLKVSHLRGFPKLYGYGSIAGSPAIVMEWVEGVSLRRAMRDADEPFEAHTVAGIGAGVLDVLESLGRLDATLAHRDISPANIMVRIGSATFEEQAERGAFDICLVDFGSSAAEAPESDPSFTVVTRMWRNGTPEYAPPEMLTKDVPHIDELRKSQKIDVFALCSVLYELYAGHTPWRVSEHPGASPYRLKTEHEPEPLVARRSEDEPFVRAIMSGLAIRQAERPSVAELLADLRAFLGRGGASCEAGPAAASSDAGVVAPPGDGASASASAGTSSADSVPAGIAPAGIASAGASSADSAPAGVAPAGVASADSPLGAAGLQLSGFDIADPMTPGPKTPDSANLHVAGVGEGGKRAGEAVPAFKQEVAAPVSRRSLIVAGAALAVAAISGGLIIRMGAKGGGIGAHSIHDAALAGGVYDGEPLYPARDYYSNAWQLVSAVAAPIAIGSSGHEPGTFACGLIRAFHEESSGYGFKTVESAGDGMYEARWAFPRTFANAGNFSLASEGQGGAKRLAAVQDPDTRLWGYIDEQGNDAIGARFFEANAFNHGFATCRVGEDAESWALVDAGGSQRAVSGYLQLGANSAEGLIAALAGPLEWCFITADGERAFDGSWQDVGRFECGLAGAYDEKAGLWGFVDVSGEFAIDPRFREVRPFSQVEGSDPVAPAQDAETELWGLVYPTGSWAVEPRYLKLGERTGELWPAHGSPANVYDLDSAEWEAYEATGQDVRFGYGYIDASGEWVHKPTFGDTLIRPSSR